jgi:hypothetical protein
MATVSARLTGNADPANFGEAAHKGRGEGANKAGAQIERTQCIRAEQPHAAQPRRRDQLLLHRRALGIDLGKAGRKDDRRTRALGGQRRHRLQDRFGGHGDDGDIGCGWQVGNRGIGLEALNFRPVRVDRVNLTLELTAQHVVNRPPANPRRIR